MTVHPFPQAAGATREAFDEAGAIPFPIVPRGTALLRRHPTAEDFARGNLVRPFPPRAGRVTLLLADTAAEAARDRLAALRARAAERARPRPDSLRRLIVWAGSVAPAAVATTAGVAAVVAWAWLLTRPWS